jgi:crotonobetainyl-CoA:carnitine CoA-transferase CaiB-like acyl-CoA transferase
MLHDVRVLELSAPETMLAGRILADLGADVIAVEPPGGAAGRRLEPFLDETPGIERSLTWHALNYNKRAITLDLSSPDGAALLGELASRFDVIIEAAAEDGSSPVDSIELPVRLIRCSITRFSRGGPKAAYAATDFTVIAASGAPGMTGTSDRPPLYFPVPQAMLEAGADAAIAALVALVARDRDGLGQRAEVSARIAAMMAAFSQPLAPGSGNPPPARSEGALAIAGVKIPGVFECTDGFALVTVAFGPVFGQMTQRLAKWAADEGHLDPRVAAVSWPSFIADLSARKASPADLQALMDGVAALARSKTKSEIAAMARKLGLLASPVMNMADVAAYAQYRERGLFARVGIDADREIDAPIRFAQFSDYSIALRRPAPQLSQHTGEILERELRLSKPEVQALFVAGVI